MSFYAPHIALAAVLRDKVQNLEKYSKDLFLVFGEFLTAPDTANLVGNIGYVKKVMESFLGPNKKVLEVNLYNTPSPPGNYALFVEYTGTTGEEQFLGEHAGYSFTPAISEKVFTSFVPKHLLSTCPKTLVFNSSEVKECLIWPYQECAVSTGPDSKEYFTIKSVLENNSQVLIELDREVPKGLLNRNWTVQAPSYGTVDEYSATLDTVRLRITLRTPGEIETHLLMCMMVRWLLKLARTELRFTDNNLQASNLTQGAPVLESESPDFFTTSFDFSCTASDTWITSRSTSPSQMGLTVEAESLNAQNEVVLV